MSDFADSDCINPNSRVLAHRMHLASNGALFANYALNNQENFVLWLGIIVKSC